MAAQADASSVEAGFFFFRHHPDDYEAWYDVPTLPKFDLRDAELRRRLLDGPDSVTAKWLRPPFDLDGWRVDVANMAGRNRGIDVNHAVAVAMRRTMAEAKADAYLVAEHCYDASRDLDGDGWHGVMNYLAFTRPVWAWLRDPDDEAIKFLGDPAPLPRFGGHGDCRVGRRVARRAAVAVRRLRLQPVGVARHDAVPQRVRQRRPPRRRRRAAVHDARRAAGVRRRRGRHHRHRERRRPPADAVGRRAMGPPVFDAYRSLGALHRASPALRRGGLRWVHASDDVLVYLRESRDERVLVQVGRADHEPVAIDAAALDGVVGERRFGDGDVVATRRRRSCCRPPAPPCTSGS